jgi:hypothetical protein
MADLVAANVTVTLDQRDVDFMAMATKVTFPSIAFGASSGLAYPTGGIPMPAMGAFGMKKEIRRIFISPRAADGLIWKYDKVNHKMMAYQAGGVVTATLGSNTAGTPTGNVTARALSIDTIHANLTSNDATNGVIANVHVDVGTATGNLNAGGLTMEAMANHTHTFTAGDVTDAPLAEYPNADILAKVLDLMVIGS